MSTKNKPLLEWVDKMAALCQPSDVVWCDGSKEEYDTMWDILVKSGSAERLDDAKRPNSYYVRSVPADVARVEDRTYICSENEQDAGPTNNIMVPVGLDGEAIKMPDVRSPQQSSTRLAFNW